MSSRSASASSSSSVFCATAVFSRRTTWTADDAVPEPREPVITSDRKHQSASNKHGDQVEHSTWRGGVVAKSPDVPQRWSKMMSKLPYTPRPGRGGTSAGPSSTSAGRTGSQDRSRASSMPAHPLTRPLPFGICLLVVVVVTVLLVWGGVCGLDTNHMPINQHMLPLSRDAANRSGLHVGRANHTHPPPHPKPHTPQTKEHGWNLLNFGHICRVPEVSALAAL